MKNTITSWIVVALSLTICTSAFAVGTTKGRTGGERPGERTRARDAAEGVDAIRTERDHKAEERITQTLGVSRAEIAKTMRELKNDPTEYEALKRLLRQAQGKGTVENNRVISSYLRLMNNSVGEFHMKPSIVEARVKTWSANAKSNLASSLEGAVKIASENRAVTREDAFNRSLKETGRLEKYKEMCKK